MPIAWEEIQSGEFEALAVPQKSAKTDPEWEEIITALEAGKVVKLPYKDEKELRGKRLSVGRRAIKRGFRVELRYGEGFIAARKREGGRFDGVDLTGIDQALTELSATTAAQPVRRRRKTAAAATG